MTSVFEGLPLLDLRTSASLPAHREHWARLCRRSAGLDGDAQASARAIVDDVRARGDAAVAEYTERFEGRQIKPEAFEVDPMIAARAKDDLEGPLRLALAEAAANIELFHRTQVPATTGLDAISTPHGAALHSRVTPLRRVAVYAPGGTAAYPSSVLMAGVPARVAGVEEIVLITPRPSPVVLAAASIAGIHRIFQIGGAQAIGAVAFGTERVPRVDKIVGPGNAYVTAAKRHVFGHCDIDSIAGPSEILVMADAEADAELVAADLISQAEHDLLASAILITDHAPLAQACDAALRRQLADLPRAEIAGPALTQHGACVLVDDLDAMIDETNAFAPEHLELLVAGAPEIVDRLTAAGAIFVGGYTPEAAGDYTAGPSHVLPTAGGARFASPLGVWDFVKYTSVLHLNEATLRAQATAITTLARAEGLEGHARAVEYRLRTNDEGTP